MLTKAIEWIFGRDYDKADEQLRRAFDLSPNYFEVLRVEAQLRVAENDFLGAEASYEAALSLAPDRAPLRLWFGGFLSRHLGDQERALEQLLEAERLAPSSAVVKLECARILQYVRRFEEAEQRLCGLPDIDRLSAKTRRVHLDLSIQNFIRKTEHCLGQEQFLPALESLEQAQHLYSNAPRTLIDYRTEHNIARAKRQIQPLLRAFRGLPEERRVKQLAEWIDGSGGTLLLPTTENADQDGSVEHSADEREAAFMPTAGRLCGLQSSYGFIDANGSRLFFHRGDWNGHIDYLALGEGHPVEFELGSNHKGPCAVRVRPAGTSKGPVAVSHIGHVALLESTFGFIERSGGTRIFFHRTTCAEGTQFKSLQVGERVRFTVGVGNDGRPCAGDVERYSGM